MSVTNDIRAMTACGTCAACRSESPCTSPVDWISRVLIEAQSMFSKGRHPTKVWIAPEDADLVTGKPEGSHGDNGLIGSVAGLALLCTYRVRVGFWMVTE